MRVYRLSAHGITAGGSFSRWARLSVNVIVAEELRPNWKEPDLLQRRKGDPAKLAITARLRRETTLSIKAIANRIHLGTSRSANNRLHAAMSQTACGRPAQPTLGLLNFMGGNEPCAGLTPFWSQANLAFRNLFHHH